MVGQGKTPYHLAWKRESFEVSSATEQPQKKHFNDVVLNIAHDKEGQVFWGGRGVEYVPGGVEYAPGSFSHWETQPFAFP